MRTYSFTSPCTGTLQYPDAFMFAFNPNYLEFTLYKSDGTTLATTSYAFTITVKSGSNSYAIEAGIYAGNGRVYISRLLQLLFSDDVLNARSIDVTVTVAYGGTTIATLSGVALWGGLQIGEQFGSHGIYAHNKNGNGVDFVREAVWFPNFPFTLSMFRASTDEGLTVTVDKVTTKADESLTASGIIDIDPTDYVAASDIKNEARFSIGLGTGGSAGVFAAVFDYTFVGDLENLREITRVRVDNSTTGYYIRWIDQFGFLQYYLFVKGQRTSKNKLSSNEIDWEQQYNGMYFGNLIRYQQVTNTDTIKCSAVNLSERVLAYVETIVKSPYIDLYLGKDKDGQEIWLPINIVSGSYKVSADKVLQDYEISFTLPETIIQSL